MNSIERTKQTKRAGEQGRRGGKPAGILDFQGHGSSHGGHPRAGSFWPGLLGHQVALHPHVPARVQPPPSVSSLPGSLLAANVSFCARVSLAIRTNASASTKDKFLPRRPLRTAGLISELQPLTQLRPSPHREYQGLQIYTLARN